MSIIPTLRKLRRTSFFKSNLWEVRIYSPEYFAVDFVDSYFLASSIAIPFPSIEFERDIIQQQSYITGSIRPEEISISFLETENLDTTKFLDTLYDLIYTEDYIIRADVIPTVEIDIILQRFRKGLTSVAAQAVGSALSVGGLGSETIGIVTEYTEPIRGYKINGALYKSRSDISLDYETGDLTKIDATFAIGDIRKMTNLELQATTEDIISLEI